MLGYRAGRSSRFAPIVPVTGLQKVVLDAELLELAMLVKFGRTRLMAGHEFSGAPLLLLRGIARSRWV